MQISEIIASRQEELNAYQLNIDMYNSLLANLPSELPARLEEYRQRPDKHVAATEIQNLDDVSLLADVWYFDEIKGRIRSEIVEMRKVQAIISVLEAQA